MLPSGSAGLLAPSPPPPAPRGEHFASGVLGNRNRRKLRREILGPLRDLHRHLARHALVQTGDLAVGVAHHAGPPAIGLDTNAQVQRKRAEVVHAVFGSELLAAFGAENMLAAEYGMD